MHSRDVCGPFPNNTHFGVTYAGAVPSMARPRPLSYLHACVHVHKILFCNNEVYTVTVGYAKLNAAIVLFATPLYKSRSSARERTIIFFQLVYIEQTYEYTDLFLIS